MLIKFIAVYGTSPFFLTHYLISIDSLPTPESVDEIFCTSPSGESLLVIVRRIDKLFDYIDMDFINRGVLQVVVSF